MLLNPVFVFGANNAAERVVPTIKADLAQTDLHVGSGQTYASLQAAINAIPATPSANYRILVHPGTYLAQSTIQNKNTAKNNAVISIENAESSKPLIVGASFLQAGSWGVYSGGVYKAHFSTSIRAITHVNERLKKVANIEEVKRLPNSWYQSGGTVYAHLRDLMDPNQNGLQIISRDHGLVVDGVRNVLIKGIRFEHFAKTAIWFKNAERSSVRSVWAEDIGQRGSNDAGIFFENSPTSSAINVVASSILGSGVRLLNSRSVQLYNNSFHRVVFGTSLTSSQNCILQNNVYGTAFQFASQIDNSSRTGLVTQKNVYYNPSGAIGEVNGSVKNTVADLAAALGGEADSKESDPLFRSTTAAQPSEENWLLNIMHDLDAVLFSGQGWSNETDAAKLRWDQGFLGDAYMKMYRATRDVRWLEKLVDQSDKVWGQAYENPVSPGSSADGYVGWSTSRYSTAVIKPANVVSAGGNLRLATSGGTVLLPPDIDLRVYGPGNFDNLPNRTLELRFSLAGDLRFKLYDVTGSATCIANCSLTKDNYPDGQKNVTRTDSDINAAANGNTINWQIRDQAPQNGDIFSMQFKAKKLMETANIDAGLTAPMIDFAAEVFADSSIQNLPVAGSTFLTKAQDYVDKVATNIWPKWDPYFKNLSLTGGSILKEGGIYVYPNDEQYAIPGNTLPLNMQSDLLRLWTYMYRASGDAKYKKRAYNLATFIKARMSTRTSSVGKSYYYWNYYYRSGNWDNWTQNIPEDINHGGLVADAAQIAHETGIVFNSADIERYSNTFTANFWDPVNTRMFWYIDRTVPITYGGSIYWFHDWLELPGAQEVGAQLVYDIYSSNSYNTITGVIYQMMADAALQMARQAGSENYRLRPGSLAIRSGNNHGYDRDYDDRVRSTLGTFDRGAFSYITLERLWGSNRYKTAVAISQSAYPQSGRAGGVVLARGDVFADGLAGATLAAQKNAPMLLTKSTELLPEVKAELQRVLAPGGTVWLLGGTAALAGSVDEAVQAAGYQTKRLQGSDRYATAVAIAGELDHYTDAIIASGTSFPDPLAASAVAVNRNLPILLAKKSSLPAATKNFLSGNLWNKLYVVGGPAALNNDVSDAVAAFGQVERVYGSNRYGTATALAQKFFASADSATFTTGTNFPDSLVAGPHAGSAQVQGPIILVKPDAVPQEVSSYLKTYAAKIMGGFIYGGSVVVSEGVKSSLESSL